MKLSEQREYLIAIPAKVRGDYQTARSNLEALISRLRIEPGTPWLGFILQTLGDVEALDGRLEEGHRLHQEAVALDPGSPMPLLHYAEGLLRAFARPDLAKLRLSEAEAKLADSSWRETE